MEGGAGLEADRFIADDAVERGLNEAGKGGAEHAADGSSFRVGLHGADADFDRLDGQDGILQIRLVFHGLELIVELAVIQPHQLAECGIEQLETGGGGGVAGMEVRVIELGGILPAALDGLGIGSLGNAEGGPCVLHFPRAVVRGENDGAVAGESQIAGGEAQAAVADELVGVLLHPFIAAVVAKPVVGGDEVVGEGRVFNRQVAKRRGVVRWEWKDALAHVVEGGFLIRQRTDLDAELDAPLVDDLLVKRGWGDDEHTLGLLEHGPGEERHRFSKAGIPRDDRPVLHGGAGKVVLLVETEFEEVGRRER